MAGLSKLEEKYIDGQLGDYVLNKLGIKHRASRMQRKILALDYSNKNSTERRITSMLVWEFNRTSFMHAGISRQLLERLSHLFYLNRTSIVSRESYQELLQAFKPISNSALSFADWNKLVFLCNANGLFKLAGIVREKSITLLVNRYANKKSVPNAIAMFKACIDGGDYKQAREIIDEVSAKSSSSYVQYLSERFCDYRAEERASNPHFVANSERYADILRSKRVAIVAPGLLNIDDALIDEINSYDLMIVFTYKGTKIDARFNIPCVSYYNCEKSALLVDSFHEFADDLEFCVFKSVDHAFQAELIEQGRAKVLEGNLNDFFLYKEPNMVQLVLDDILRYECLSVKVFGSNFFLNETIYTGIYEDLNKSHESLANMWKVFCNHSLLSQINYVRNLYNMQLIDVDKMGLDVLEMPEEKILDGYEILYSNIE